MCARLIFTIQHHSFEENKTWRVRKIEASSHICVCINHNNQQRRERCCFRFVCVPSSSFHLSRLFVDRVTVAGICEKHFKHSLHDSMVMFAVAEHDKKLANIYHFHKRMLTNHKWLWSNGYCGWIKNSLFASAFVPCAFANWHFVYKTHLLLDRRANHKSFFGLKCTTRLFPFRCKCLLSLSVYQLQMV